MTNKWIDYLTETGINFNSDREVINSSTSGLPEAELYLTDLSWLGIMEVRGDDRLTYLQGQLTNDINAVSSSLSQLSALCTPKGRMRALFHIIQNTIQNEDSLLLQLPYSLLAENIRRLKMFILMSKVELNDVSDDIIKIGLAGKNARQVLQNAGFTIPEQTNMVTQHNNMLLLRLAGDIPRFECLGYFDAIQTLWDSLTEQAELLSTQQWRLLDIKAGIPNVFPQTAESFIPQMVNLQFLNGVNFKKGCYTGQEVVARMQYLGKLKRRMYLADCQSETLPEPGASLYSASSSSGQGAGNIVDAQFSAQGEVTLLAVITNDAVEKQDIFLDEAMQQPLTIQELPYAVNID